MGLSLLWPGMLEWMKEWMSTLSYTFSEAAEAAKQYATGVNLDGRPLRINFGKV